jgi:NAD(P)-dependent dehydrogenase (short-subunit alcohol dehydrogenase family)
MAKLAGKVAVITGATSEMALATAKLFVEEGAYVFITGRRQQQLDAAVKAIGRNVTGVQGDADHLTDLDRLYETVNWTGSCNDTQVFPGAWIRLLPQDCLDSPR